MPCILSIAKLSEFFARGKVETIAQIIKALKPFAASEEKESVHYHMKIHKILWNQYSIISVDNSKARASVLPVGVGGGCLNIFCLPYLISFVSPSL